MQQRQCVILDGNEAWCRQAAQTLLADYDLQHCICLTAESLAGIKSIAANKAQTLLGQEFDAVVIDGFSGINPDHIGSTIGTVIAGGVLIIMHNTAGTDSLWTQRFKRICEDYNQHFEQITIIQQDDAVISLAPPEKAQHQSAIVVQRDQQQAIDAILKVVHGHRRRPLVLTADRGRGKSAALGLAAAELIKQGKQRILVTAPSYASAATVFDYAHRDLSDSTFSQGLVSLAHASIEFIAPDRLLEGDYSADLVLVDEAAAIPASILEQLLTKFSRLVFSSTIHGYEGTGRGFAIRFQQTLDKHTPNWNRHHIEQPIRWRDDDVLEKFSFAALLLDASPVDADKIADASIEQCVFEKLDRQQLVKNDSELRSIYGLMVLAHYRTRPSDLLMMLDRDDISVYVMRLGDHIIASSWSVNEGGFEPELSQAVYAGERRLKGHLLPQSLLAHAGLVDAGDLSYLRIIRLAVHPELQNKGIGQQFMKQIVADASQYDFDMVGASFASSVDIINFWSQCGFSVARLGLHHDEMSGSHAMMMLTAVSNNGKKLVDNSQRRFSQQWPLLLQQHFHHLQPELVTAISQLLVAEESVLSEDERYELEAFAYKQRGFEACQIVIGKLISIYLSQQKYCSLSPLEQALCIMLVLQQRSLSDVSKQLALKGKADIIKSLRAAIATLLS